MFKKISKKATTKNKQTPNNMNIYLSCNYDENMLRTPF